MLSKLIPSTHKNTNPLPDWSAVPSDVLREISKRLISWDDYVGFRSVCNPWRSSSSKMPQVPLLIITSPDGLQFCNFPNAELYIPSKLPVSISQSIHICGSSHGWIFTEGTSPNNTPITISMCNPFTGVVNPLPALPYRKLPYKIIIPFNPMIEPLNYTIVARCSDSTILYCHPRDDFWSSAFYPESNLWIHDNIFYNGNLYTVVNSYRIFCCQLGPDDSKFSEVLPKDPLFPNRQLKLWHLPTKPIHPDINIDDDVDNHNLCIGPLRDELENEEDTRSYLVVSSGDLLLVEITKTRDKVSNCYVFQVDMCDGKLRLMELESLGGRALFLGDQSMSFSISVDSTFPPWCRGNCIYYGEEGMMTTVLNMEDYSISYMTDILGPFKLWITPTMC